MTCMNSNNNGSSNTSHGTICVRQNYLPIHWHAGHAQVTSPKSQGLSIEHKSGIQRSPSDMDVVHAWLHQGVQLAEERLAIKGEPQHTSASAQRGITDDIYDIAAIADTLALEWFHGWDEDLFESYVRTFLGEGEAKNLLQRFLSDESLLLPRRCFIEHVLALPTISLPDGREESLLSLLFGEGDLFIPSVAVEYLLALRGSYLGLYRVFGIDGPMLHVVDEFGEPGEVLSVRADTLATLFAEGSYVGMRLIRMRNTLVLASGVYPMSKRVSAIVKEATLRMMNDGDYHGDERRLIIDGFVTASANVWLTLLERGRIIIQQQ